LSFGLAVPTSLPGLILYSSASSCAVHAVTNAHGGQAAGELWSNITDREGWHHRCEYKEHYRANINIPVHYNDPGSITNIRQVLAYMTKIQQKEGLLLHGCNEVPERPLTGRPRLPLRLN